MRALLLLLAPLALAQPPSPSIAVTAYDADGHALCTVNGLWTNEPGVAELPRACLLKAARAAARTPAGAELPLTSIRGESAAEDRLLAGFAVPAQPTEMLFGAYRSPLAGGRLQALAQWQAALDPAADAELRAALALLNQGQPAAALPRLTAVTRRANPSAEAWFLLATARERTGDPAGALAALERAVSAGTIHRAALERLVVAYVLVDRREAAEALIRRLRPASPDLASTLSTLLEQTALGSVLGGGGVSGSLTTSPLAAPPQ